MTARGAAGGRAGGRAGPCMALRRGCRALPACLPAAAAAACRARRPAGIAGGASASHACPDPPGGGGGTARPRREGSCCLRAPLRGRGRGVGGWVGGLPHPPTHAAFAAWGSASPRGELGPVLEGGGGLRLGAGGWSSCSSPLPSPGPPAALSPAVPVPPKRSGVVAGQAGCPGRCLRSLRSP